MDDKQLDRKLQRSFRPLTPTRRQRQRYRDLLLSREVKDMQFLRRRSYAELGVIVALLVLVIGGVAAWQFMNGNSDNDSDDPVAAAGATLTARAEALIESTPTSSPVPTVLTTGAVCTVDPIQQNPSPNLPGGDPAFQNWYGDKAIGLWASPYDSTAYFPAKVSIESTGYWFSGGINPVLWFGTTTPIEVTGRKLNGSATFKVDKPEFIDTIAKIQNTVLNFPEPGCWEITGKANDDQLTIRVEVLPLQERPDFKYAVQLHNTQPYVEPQSCAVSTWVGPDLRENLTVPMYWLEDQQDSLGTSGGLLWAGDESILTVAGLGNSSDFAIIAQSQGAPSLQVGAETNRNSADTKVGTIIFPQSGCWDLSVFTEDTSTTFTVYVYPADCMPEEGSLDTPSGCREPQQ